VSTSGFRALPSVDKVLADPRIGDLLTTYDREAVVNLVRSRLEEARGLIRAGKSGPALDVLVESVRARALALWSPSLRPVINATGVIIHTNLGRAPLSREALDAIASVSRGYSTLEFDLASGQRGSRHAHVEHLLCQLTGAEAALAVNNNASAILLGLSALCKGKEVIVSRGEAVEIGGGFRIPDVLRQSGATLVEVGTTNRTYVADYEAAITENTAALLAVHSSNFRVVGFTHHPTLEELVDLGKRTHIPVLYDIGSGCLLDTTAWGMAHEPTPQEGVAAGAAAVFFSGDKLLGGPQCGVATGRKDVIDQLKRHPLARAVRIDKLSLAALAATLLHYVKNEAADRIPVWRMISAPAKKLDRRARAWAAALGSAARVVDGESTVGGGSLPGETLPTRLVALSASNIEGGATEVAARLRRNDPPVIARIDEEMLLLDPRTVLPDEDKALLKAVRAALAS